MHLGACAGVRKEAPLSNENDLHPEIHTWGKPTHPMDISASRMMGSAKQLPGYEIRDLYIVRWAVISGPKFPP